MLQYKIIEIFTSEQAQWQGQSVHSAVINHINKLRIAARTMITKGIGGSYESGEMVSEWVEVLSFNMPLRITIILPASEADKVIAGLKEMVTDGIIALRELEVVQHRTSGDLLPKHTRVREIMTPSPVTVSGDTPVSEVVRLLLSSTFSGVPVVDATNRPVGVIAQGDLIYKANMPLRLGLLTGSDRTKTDEVLSTLSRKKAEEIMSQPAITVEQDQPATKAVELMLAKNLKRLPVVDSSGKLVGILSRLDIFHTILRECPDLRELPKGEPKMGSLRTVADIVRRDTSIVLPDTPVEEVIRIIDCNDIERVGVVDTDGRFLGLISDRDLLIAFLDRHPGIWEYFMRRLPFTERGMRYRELQDLLRARTAAEVMKSEVVTVREDTPLDEAIRLMLERTIKRLPVVDGDGKFKGMISREALMRAGFASLQR